MTRIDAILAIIDTGLQTAGDAAYGTDAPGTCWRCGEAGDDLCPTCREWLLAEHEAVDMNLDLGAFQTALDEIGTAAHLEPWQLRRLLDEHAGHITNGVRQ